MNASCPPSTCASPAAGVTETLRKPPYHVTSTAEACELRIVMPGVPKAGVHLQLEDNVLTVRGERRAALPEGWKPLHRELSPLGYQLRLRLNLPVDEARLSASLDSGILTVRLPVQEAAKPRRIEVQ